MSVLVTGAKGGFGRILAQWLRQQANETFWLTDIAEDSDELYIQCDMGNAAAIRAMIRRVRPQRIFHLAGSFSNSYDLDYQINALSARHLCETLMAEHSAARLILIGSAAEYGLILPDENPVREDHVLQPVSVYGLTKAIQTHFATYYAQLYDVNVVVARLFNLNAPGLSERLFIGRVEQLIDRFKRKEIDVIELGNLESQRDYIKIEDALPQLLLIADKGKKGDVYHVASGRPVRMRDLLAEMLASANLDMSVVCEDKSIERKIGYDIPIIYADMSKTTGLTRKPEETSL
jgi:GDP-4-dehydro-6-deoxy-D-mannose reductase